MKTQEALNYERVAAAITYIKTHFKEQPSLERIAEAVNLSPFHFQRLFSDWAGLSPKQFVAYLSLDYAKKVLKKKDNTLFDIALETGLSGTGRLHDLFVKTEGMTPGEFKNGGEALRICFSFSWTLFGRLLSASTSKGLCFMAFAQNDTEALEELYRHFPNAVFREEREEVQEAAAQIFSADWSQPKQIRLHLKGSPFQLKVWNALLQIPSGQLSAYGSIAQKIGSANASRAVGTAIGQNPIAFIIPCHRVIQASGHYGQYRWGETRKSALIAWEAAKIKSLE